jgi:hypothetical protein
MAIRLATGRIAGMGLFTDLVYQQKPGCDCENPAFCLACTPPAENSNPSGASDGADGQGVCIPRYSLTYAEGRLCHDDGACDFPTCIGCDHALVVQTGFVAADAVVLLRSLLARGVSPVTVNALP